jgi:AcrR family transcriptional regulator
MQRTTLKARILDFTEARLWEQGYRGMRVDELARDVGISKRTLYEQFRTKEQMAHDALERRLDRLQVGIDEIIANHDDHAVQLRKIVGEVTQVFAHAKTPFFRDLETTPSLVELVERSNASSHTKLEQVIVNGMNSGRFKPEVDAEVARRVLLAAVHGITKTEADAPTRERLSRSAIDLILGGLLVC